MAHQLSAKLDAGLVKYSGSGTAVVNGPVPVIIEINRSFFGTFIGIFYSICLLFLCFWWCSEAGATFCWYWRGINIECISAINGVNNSISCNEINDEIIRKWK
jgi:hypothetical protein